jgi:hypothetical protein
VSYGYNCAQNGNKEVQTQSALNPKHEIRNSKQYQMTQCHKQERFGILDFENSDLFRISMFEFRISRLGTLFGSGCAALDNIDRLPKKGGLP